MATGVQVKGLNQVVRSLERFGVEVSDLKSAFRKIGNLVVDDARPRTNPLTGRLAGSIRASNSKNKSLVRAGGARIPYAGVIHYGGYHNIEAKNFLTEAIEAQQGAAVRTLDTELSGLIRSLDLN
jgi:hypothetical protein